MAELIDASFHNGEIIFTLIYDETDDTVTGVRVENNSSTVTAFVNLEHRTNGQVIPVPVPPGVTRTQPVPRPFSFILGRDPNDPNIRSSSTSTFGILANGNNN